MSKSSSVHIRKPYDPHERVRVEFSSPSLAKQSMQAECDINNIMRQFDKTGLLSHTNKHNGDYGNFLSAQEYHESMNAVLAARDAFDSLPSKIRGKFANDPALFLDFVQNPDNAEELVEMGLGEKPAPIIEDPSPAPEPEISASEAE